MGIGKEIEPVYVVRVQTPSGDQLEVDSTTTIDAKQAVRVATAIAAWLAVDKWESASRFVPEGVREVAEDVVACYPEVDLSRCTVLVLSADERSKTNNGYSIRAAFRVGAIVPNILRSIREEESGSGGSRTDSAHGQTRPHISQNRIKTMTQEMFDEITKDKDDFGF